MKRQIWPKSKNILCSGQWQENDLHLWDPPRTGPRPVPRAPPPGRSPDTAASVQSPMSGCSVTINRTHIAKKEHVFQYNYNIYVARKKNKT